jgi:hypothetical protein
MATRFRIILAMGLLLSLVSGCKTGIPATSAVPLSTALPTTFFTPVAPTFTAAPAPTKPPITPTAHASIPYNLISQESLFNYLTDLTSIRPYAGWRNSATIGEAQAQAYVEQKLGEFPYLHNLGLELEHQSFPVFLSTQIWETRLHLSVGDQEFEVPAEGLRGSRFDPNLALHFDSDGKLNDSNRNPVVVKGSLLVVDDPQKLYATSPAEVQGKVIFLDYALIDTIVSGEAEPLLNQVPRMINMKPAGIVLITQYSNEPGESRGTVIGDGGVFQRLDFEPTVPILHANLENLAPAGIQSWNDLAKVGTARLTWDADVYLPGKSGNLVARIPGLDPTKAIILSAHIDSPNSPGVFDDGGGSAILLEVARVLDKARLQPPVDLYLAWFGGHEIGAYGSSFFVSTHQELLDRTLAMLQTDCLGHPMEGKTSDINLSTWSFGRFGDDTLPWPNFLTQAVKTLGLAVIPQDNYGLESDNTSFAAFNVPNANLIYMDYAELRSKGNSYIHYSNHWHDPYESVPLAREVGEAFTGMAKVALAAALETGWEAPDLRVPPTSQRRALFIASHTEQSDIAPLSLAELGQALAWEGFDVDLIPYGQPLSSTDLENVDLVVLLPTLDYPGQPDEVWSTGEVAVLQTYVDRGGFLVVTNSANNIAMNRLLNDMNEDSRTINALLEGMGVRFTIGEVNGDMANSTGNHPLIDGAQYLSMFGNNAVLMQVNSGQVLATADKGKPVLAVAKVGEQGGQVLVVADIGLLIDFGNGAKNFQLIKNIARYALER